MLDDLDDFLDRIQPEEVMKRVNAATDDYEGKTNPVVPQDSWKEDEQVVNLPASPPDPQSYLPVEHRIEPPAPQIPGVREVTYSAPMDLDTAASNSKGPWVQYNGVATVRILTPSDWAAAGVKSSHYCEWNYLNGKRLPRSMFSDEELQYLLRVDGRFSLEKE